MCCEFDGMLTWSMEVLVSMEVVVAAVVAVAVVLSFVCFD